MGTFLRGVEGGQDVPPGAGARVKTALFPQDIEGFIIGGLPVRLPYDRAVPAQPEPCEVVVDLIFPCGAGSCAIYILDPQQEAPARRARQIMGDGRGIRVAEVQRPRGGRCEAADDANLSRSA